MNRNIYLISGLGALAIVLGAWLLGNGFKRKPAGEYINVTGMAEVNFKSDQVIWHGNFNRMDAEMKTVYEQMQSDAAKVSDYFRSKGIKDDEISISGLSMNKEFSYERGDNGMSHEVFKGYRATQYVTIKSSRLDAIEQVAKQSMELIQQGIEFNAGSTEYYFTNLADLKLDLVEKASADALNRAKKIAAAAGTSLGKLKKANLGIFQITGENENEEYTYGGAFNTSSRDKKARVTLAASYIPD